MTGDRSYKGMRMIYQNIVIMTAKGHRISATPDKKTKSKLVVLKPESIKLIKLKNINRKLTNKIGMAKKVFI